MPRATKTLYALNRGIISKQGLARVDLDRTNMSAEVMTNWMPRTLGSMQLRCGWQYRDTVASQAKYLPFVFSLDDLAHLEFTANTLGVRIDDALIARVAVTAAVTNGNFDATILGWTNNDEAGATSAWLAGGYMSLLGTGSTAAIRDQSVAVTEVGTEHALRIVVARGPVILRVGTSSTDDSYINETTLGTGTHSLAFTPAGAFNIRVMNRRSFPALLDSINVEGAGTMTLPTPYAVVNYEDMRRTQSGDVIFIACAGLQQRRIERRAARSWSIVLYESETGPFRNLNTTPITLAPTAITGEIHIASSKALFRPTHVGALFRIESNGQQVTAVLGAANVFTNPIRVVGVGGGRQIAIVLTGVFNATVTLQYSIGAPGSWVDSNTYTVPTSTSFNDGLDNQEIYYRIGIKVGDYVSGAATAFLVYSSGSITGVARITEFVTSQDVKAVVLSDFGSLDATDNWSEGEWSDYRGWPTAVTICESRMTFAGAGIVEMSISDAYDDFDDTFEGDAGPISRTIGEGPIERIPWLLALDQLVIGVETSCANVEAIKILGSHPLVGRSSSFDEPITPTNFNLKTADAAGAYVDTSRTRLLEVAYNVNSNGYTPEDLSVAVPDLNEDIRQIAVQYKPDQRIYCRRGDGTAGVMIRDRAENLICWVELETAGFIEDISVMPGAVEDRVYLSVRRTINGAERRFLERVALESECRGQPEAYLADAHRRFSSDTETRVINNLASLEGEEVVAWGWNLVNPITDDLGHTIGVDLGTFTVVGGAITVPISITHACAGLAYTAQWKSCKLAFAAQMGTALNVKGKVHKIGLVLSDFHAQGLRYGADFDNLDDMPLVEGEEEISEDRMWDDYDEPFFEFDGDWSTDTRICLEAAAPRPCTVLAIGIDQTKSG